MKVFNLILVLSIFLSFKSIISVSPNRIYWPKLPAKPPRLFPPKPNKPVLPTTINNIPKPSLDFQLKKKFNAMEMKNEILKPLAVDPVKKNINRVHACKKSVDLKLEYEELKIKLFALIQKRDVIKKTIPHSQKYSKIITLTDENFDIKFDKSTVNLFLYSNEQSGYEIYAKIKAAGYIQISGSKIDFDIDTQELSLSSDEIFMNTEALVDSIISQIVNEVINDLFNAGETNIEQLVNQLADIN